MNYTIEEKLKEIPIACVREKALLYWYLSDEKQKQDMENCFLSTSKGLPDAIKILQRLTWGNFWVTYYEYMVSGDDLGQSSIFTMITLWRFQCETIFKSATPNEQLLKLQEEIEEIKQELDTENVDKSKLGTEIADGIIVLLSLAQAAGISTEDILFSYLPNKIFKNVNRNWVKLEDGTFKHVKE